MIGIPHRLGDWSLLFTDKTYVPLKFHPSRVFQGLFLLARTASITAARNAICQHTLDTGSSYLFFLDCDVILENPVQKVEQLIACNWPIVSGFYRRKAPEGFQPCMFHQVEPGKYSPIPQWTGNWITADAVGMGCCLIKREVLEKVQKPWFSWDDPNAVSEDFYFCQKARQAGYEIKVFTDVQASHIGTLQVMPDGTFKTLEM